MAPHTFTRSQTSWHQPADDDYGGSREGVRDSGHWFLAPYAVDFKRKVKDPVLILRARGKAHARPSAPHPNLVSCSPGVQP